MTLGRFQRLLTKVNPKLRLRYRNYGDIVGLFSGKSGKSGYILRMTKGEFTLSGYREMIVDPANNMQLAQGNIKKRGRKTVVNILRNYRWIKNHHQRTMLIYGIEKGGENA